MKNKSNFMKFWTFLLLTLSWFFHLKQGYSYECLSPKTHLSESAGVVNQVPFDVNTIKTGNEGLIELIELINSDYGEENLGDLLIFDNIRLDIGIKQELRGIEFVNYLIVDVYSNDSEINRRIDTTITEKLDGRTVGGITGIHERSLGRFIVLIRETEDLKLKSEGASEEVYKAVTPFFMEVQPSASWRLILSELQKELGPQLLKEKFPESEWRKKVPLKMAAFFRKIGFKRVYAISAKSFKEFKKGKTVGGYSKKYSYLSSQLTVDDISDWNEFFEFLFKEEDNISKQLLYGRKLLIDSIIAMQSDFSLKSDISPKEMKTLKNLVISALNSIKNNNNFFYKCVEEFDSILFDYSVKIKLNDLKRDLILTHEGKFQPEIETYEAEKEKIDEEVRWLNIEVLNKLYEGFLNKKRGVYQEKRSLQPRDLKRYYKQPWERMFWSSTKNVSISFGSNYDGEELKDAFYLHEFIDPEISLKAYGIKDFEIKSVPLDGIMKMLVVFENQQANLKFTWELEKLLSGLKGLITPKNFHQYDVRELTIWLRSKAKIPMFYPPQEIIKYNVEKKIKTAA